MELVKEEVVSNVASYFNFNTLRTSLSFLFYAWGYAVLQSLCKGCTLQWNSLQTHEQILMPRRDNLVTIGVTL